MKRREFILALGGSGGGMVKSLAACRARAARNVCGGSVC